jgi:hypothetical protein
VQVSKVISAFSRAQEVSGLNLLKADELTPQQINFLELFAKFLLAKGPQPPKKPIVGFDLEALYKMYPRKEGKTRGLAKLHAQIKTQEDYDQLKQAIHNYTSGLISTEKEFIKHFSTFANCWRDYLEAEPTKPKQLDPSTWSKS